jgi:hypothetical protein
VATMKALSKYSMETLVDGFEDCDVLSLLAASIMKAGGLIKFMCHFMGIFMFLLVFFTPFISESFIGKTLK